MKRSAWLPISRPSLSNRSPTRGLIGDASAIVFASAQTVYDCVYLALAVRLETRVITADERFERAITSNPVLAKHIRMVDAFAP